jgi:hypothetical protein
MKFKYEKHTIDIWVDDIDWSETQDYYQGDIAGLKIMRNGWVTNWVVLL